MKRTPLVLVALSGFILASSSAFGQNISATPLSGRPQEARWRVEDIPDAMDWTIHERWALYFTAPISDPHRTLFLRDLPSGRTIDLHHHASSIGFRGERAILILDESGDGDFNGDGDQEDHVCFLLDLATGSLKNSGVATPGGIEIASDDWAFLTVPETSGHDLNGDGDYADNVVATWALHTGAIANTGTAVALPLAAHESFFLFWSPGDGDHLHVYDAATGQHIDTGIPIKSVEASGAHSVLLVPESDPGWSADRDLNGDGDTSDFVLHVFDAHTGVLQDLGLAVQLPPPLAAHPLPDEFQMNASAVVFFVGESEQGGLDLNGDSDALDHVLFLHDFASGITTNLGLASFAYELDEQVLAFEAEESEQGVDLNGDGDQTDKVLHLVRLDDKSIWNVGLAPCRVSPLELAIHGTEVAFTGGDTCQTRFADAATESLTTLGTWNQREWAGDVLALLANHTLALYLPQSQRIVTDGIKADVLYPVSKTNALSVQIYEGNAGRDLNGDGDVSDLILRTVRTHF